MAGNKGRDRQGTDCAGHFRHCKNSECHILNMTGRQDFNRTSGRGAQAISFILIASPSNSSVPTSHSAVVSRLDESESPAASAIYFQP